MKGEAGEAPSDDVEYRVRAAWEKRRRMRRRLLQATMRLYAERKSVGPLVIDDVVQEAAVSRGTFYKYFESIDQAFEALEHHLTEDFVESMSVLMADQAHPAMRIALGTCTVLIRAAIDPAWGSFVAQAIYAAHAPAVMKGMRDAIEAAREGGHFTYDDLDVAVDFHSGIALQGILRVVRCGFDEGYVLNLATFCLASMGMKKNRAAKVALAALRELMVVAPGRVDWWPAEPPKGFLSAPA